MQPTPKLKPPILPDAGEPFVNILVSRIVPSPWNRKVEPTDDLVESVRQNGVMQNVILRPHIATDEDVALYSLKADPFKAGNEIFQLVAGERRWKAARKAGRSHVPASIRLLTDVQAMELQVEENEQRQNLTPMQRADAYDHLRRAYMEAHKGERGYTEAKAIEHVAASRKCGERVVYDVLSLKKLHPFVQAAINQDEMTASHGYEIARRPLDEQLEHLAWLRKETQHSQGDVPSVRRLKREIAALDQRNEEKRRQEKLFKDPQPGNSTTPVPPKGAPAQTSAKPVPPVPAAPAPKPPTEAQLKKERERTEKEQRRARRAEREYLLKQRIEKKSKGMFFSALVKKAQISSRLLTHVVPEMIFELWENVLPIESFAQEALGWPAPAIGAEYTPDEVRRHSEKHTRKYTPSLLGAMALVLFTNEVETGKLGRYFGVDLKKLRKKANAAVKEEERVVRLPKVPTTQEEKLFYHHAIRGDEAPWNKMRREGATNAEIRERLSAIFGAYGGYGSKEDGSIEYWGGKDPLVVFKSKTSKPWPRKGQPLRGAALIAAVRDLLKIPEKGDVDA
jgi:ParB/RepB/Spo0J family partition protein